MDEEITINVEEKSDESDMVEMQTEKTVINDQAIDDLVITLEKDLPVVEVPKKDTILNPDEETRQWYILQSFSGHELKVKARIERLVEENKYQEKIFKVLVPEEDRVEVKDNRRIEKKIKMYPGYVFVDMILDDEIWYEIRKLAGVSKFIGSKARPLPVVEKDMLRVLRQMGVKTTRIEVDFETGDMIKAISGPFRGYTGEIIEINTERGKLKAKISIFGRETPVELDFNQVEKEG